MAVLYTTFEEVRARLVGKVRFTTTSDNENAMQESLALSLIEEAESQVEYDLSPRYGAPFIGMVNEVAGVFADLPARPTQLFVKTMAELMACMRILETDFGRGTAVEGDNYYKSLNERYTKMRDQLLEKRNDGSGWRFPPLPGLTLAPHNSEADDGYAGAVIVANGSESMGYARGQINSPGEGFWAGWSDR